MPVLTFATEGAGNCVTVLGTPYVYAQTENGSFMLPARCPHRGGPLHLAVFENEGSRLVCPWHERATSVTRYIKAGSPAVRRGRVVTAVFPGPANTPHTAAYRPLSASLRRTRPASLS